MKKQILVLSLLGAVALTGCATSKQLPPSFYALGTSTAVSLALHNSPQLTEYLQAFQPLACSLASGAPLTPAQITLAIDATRLAGTPEGKAVANSVLMLYIVAFNSVGTNAVAARSYAEAIFCDGLADGLGMYPSPTAARLRAQPLPAQTGWPLLRRN